MSALVLGLVTALAKSSFDAVSTAIKQAAADVLSLDRTLAQYGSDTEPIRASLKRVMADRVEVLRHEVVINERQFAAHSDLKAAADPLDLSFKFAEVSQYPNFSDVKAGSRWIDSNPQFLFLRDAPSNRTQLFLAQRTILGICDG
jgi:hypothetical protein